jgi:hypothetical protein
MKKIFVLFFVLLFATVTFADKVIIYFKDGSSQSFDQDRLDRIEFKSDTHRAVSTIKGMIQGIIAGKNYAIIAKHSGLCLDVVNWGKDNGVGVIQYSCHYGANQLWQFVPAGDNYFYIKNVNSGKCLDVPNRSSGGVNIDQWECVGGENQKWQLIPQGNNYFIIKAKHSDKCLDVRNASTQPGGNVMQWDCHGGDNQVWQIKPY